jgi:GTP pyrophosphokinase
MPQVPAVTNNQANRAGREFRRLAERYGELMRAAQQREATATIVEGRGCIDVISAYRLMHQYPLRKVTMGVRRMTETALHDAASPRPSQRFKRMERILFKLLRHPHMALSTMQDIGGCRTVFETIDDLRGVERHILRSARWRDSRVEDYIDNPKPDGYRAVHIITKRDERWIEVQLRTRRQEDWATAVEEAESLTGFDIKDGSGPDDLKLYFAWAAARLALEDLGFPADAELESRFARLRDQIRHYYSAPQQ